MGKFIGMASDNGLKDICMLNIIQVEMVRLGSSLVLSAYVGSERRGIILKSIEELRIRYVNPRFNAIHRVEVSFILVVIPFPFKHLFEQPSFEGRHETDWNDGLNNGGLVVVSHRLELSG
ncbi:hypothetical protein GMJLKIPL_4770 [Methylobacterium isbiliense]|uniref:Uncharacterized protein n=1 Tax=Methylobacterium isbiliense TaxID=315478 RepID=A0ABQ4SKI4_9HYPH|nr:hypothetical protein GMJLKIPL_4770 [Methylobacterium isbiliense]